MRGFLALGVLFAVVVLADGFQGPEVVRVPKPAPQKKCCGGCEVCTANSCQCSYEGECKTLHWVASGPNDPGYYLCTDKHVWGALYPDGKYRAYTNGQWAKKFSVPPIAPPDCEDGNCGAASAPETCSKCECGAGAAFECTDDCEACGNYEGPRFRTPIRSFFYNRRPVRRLIGRILFGCCR